MIMSMKEAIAAKETKNQFMKYSADKRNQALNAMAKALKENISLIEEENQKDIQLAKKENLSMAMIDRLLLNKERINSLCQSVRDIANQEEVVGQITEKKTRPDGLIIQKQRIPIGVIAMIFESRPNVVVDCSALAIKSGNCIILKGGKEAAYSNSVLTKIIRESISAFIPINVVQSISTRDDVSELLNQVGFIDVIIPRGGEGLINYVTSNSKVPVLAHYKGLCHIFIDKSADPLMAKEITINAKASRAGVCNATETLLIHNDFPKDSIKEIILDLKKHGTEIRVDEKLHKSYPDLILATDIDWATEYLDNILSIKMVNTLDEAINHIQKYGSNHTEAIISSDQESIELFQNTVDASSIMVNASTRFNDGGEYGLGAELGISTSKLHAYGPMGAAQMTTQRFLVYGSGHTRK